MVTCATFCSLEGEGHLMTEPEETTSDWTYAVIDECAKNARQIYFVYLGSVAFSLLTVLSVSDADLVRNKNLTLAVVNVSVPLATFYIVAPILLLLLNTHLQIALVDLYQRLEGLKTGEAIARAYPWTIVRSMLLVRGQIAPSFTDRLQQLLNITGVYLSLPLTLAVFTLSYAKLHDPRTSFAVLSMPLLAVIVVSQFFARMLLVVRFTPRELYLVWATAIVSFALPARSDMFELIVGIAFYTSIAVLPVSLIMIILACVAVFFAGRKNGLALGPRLRSVVAIFMPLFVSVVVAESVIFLMAWCSDRPLRSAVTHIGIVVAILYAAGLQAFYSKRRQRWLLNALCIGIAICAALSRLVWLSVHGEGLNVDLSYQSLITADELKSPAPLTINLRDHYLDGADLTYAVLTGADMRNSRLRKAQCGNAELSKVRLSESDLAGADFSHADMAGAVLDHCVAPDANFTGANLRGANLNSVEFGTSKFDGADLEDASLLYADISGAKGIQADQILKARTIRYATLSAAIEQEVLRRRPAAIFGNADEKLRDPFWRDHLVELLLYTHPPGTRLQRGRLLDLINEEDYDMERAPTWRRAAHREYFGDIGIKALRELGLLEPSTEDSFLIPKSRAVDAALANLAVRGMRPSHGNP